MSSREDNYFTNVVAISGIVGLICLYLEWDRWMPYLMIAAFFLVSLFTFVMEIRDSR